MNRPENDMGVLDDGESGDSSPMEEPTPADLSALRDDLAFVRALAQDGSREIRAAGAAVAVAGVVWGLNGLRLWGLDAGWLAWPEGLRPFLVWDALALQLAIMVPVMMGVLRGQPKRGGAGARAVGAAMSTFAWALTVAAAGLALAAVRLENAAIALGAFPIVLFAINGSAWWVAHAVYRRVWMLAVALASFAMVLVLGWVVGTPNQWLALGLGLFLWVAAPGFGLVRHARTSG